MCNQELKAMSSKDVVEAINQLGLTVDNRRIDATVTLMKNDPNYRIYAEYILLALKGHSTAEIAAELGMNEQDMSELIKKSISELRRLI